MSPPLCLPQGRRFSPPGQGLGLISHVSSVVTGHVGGKGTQALPQHRSGSLMGGFALHLWQEHLFFSPENRERGNYQSRRGTKLCWSCRHRGFLVHELGFLPDVLGLHAMVTGTRLRGFHSRSYPRASGLDLACFRLLLASSLLGPLSWAPGSQSRALPRGGHRRHLSRVRRVRASADPVTGDPGDHTARAWPASVPELCRWWGWAPGWVWGDLPVPPSDPRSRCLHPQVTQAPTHR